MEKKEVLEKTADVLRPFETQNLMDTIQNLTLEQLFSNWWLLLVVAGILFFGVYKKSKVVLLTLFALIGLIIMVKYAMPAPGEEFGISNIVPFAAFGLGIGGVIVYFSFIKD